jgi:methionyl-tRNA formyltransferase
MRAAFLGTPPAAVPALAALLDIADVPVVITRPDRPKGRSGRPAPPAVKLAALEWGLRVVQPATGAELRAALDAADLDVGVVVAYGRILSPGALATTRAGFVNIHFSLLPRWRGSAPVERAILAGDEATGVTLMWLDEEMDTGPIIAAIETPIADDETGGSLTGRLSHLGAILLADALPDFVAGSRHPADQIETGATHAAPLHRDEGRLDPRLPADELERTVRALWPRPGAWVSADGARLKVIAGSPTGDALEPGVIAAVDGMPVLGTRDGGLALVEVQPEGGRPIAGSAWMNGRRGAPTRVDP